MAWVDFLLAPRRDHRGWNTPNEASRILLLLVLVTVSYWAWPIANGMIYMWEARAGWCVVRAIGIKTPL